MLPQTLTIPALHNVLRRGAASIPEITGELLARVSAKSDLHAFISIADEIPEIGHTDAQPLSGVPLAIKDNINTGDLPTTAGTPALRGSRPAADAPVVARLRQAGAVTLGKTNLHELAFGTTNNNATFGAARNPHAPEHSAGGSSGGSAVAVAAGLASIALGTDTGGSVRIPASYCGIVGFRPTAGRWGNEGAVPLSPTRDTIGILANTVADAALVDAVVTGESSSATVNLTGLRLGVPRHGFYSELNPEVAARTESALGRLADAGAELVEMRVVDAHELSAQFGFPLVFHEVADALPRYLATLPAAPYCHLTLADLAAQVSSPDVKAILDAILAEPTGEAVYLECLAGRGRLREAYAEAFQRSQVAALVYPTVPLPAPPLGDTDTTLHNGRQVNLFLTSTRNTGPGSLAGMPSINLPNGHTAAGLPVGLSLEGPSGDDRQLLAVAAAAHTAINEERA